MELIVARGALLLSFSTLGLFLISNALSRFTLQLSFILTPDFFFPPFNLFTVLKLKLIFSIDLPWMEYNQSHIGSQFSQNGRRIPCWIDVNKNEKSQFFYN